MLTPAENALLTQTGPGTPMGNLIRRYWIPALFSDQLPETDGRPLRTRLLGEDLIMFRDSLGRIGLVAEHCAHRGASLFFARNEECGLRCVYHGWKYDLDGRCVDMPNEPAALGFQEKVRLAAYPCREVGGVIWTYMGPPTLQPGLPELEWTLVPPSHRCASRRIQECNWLQALEGGFDPTHVPFLHRGAASAVTGLDTRLELLPSDFGLMLGQRRDLDAERTSWRINQWLFPLAKLIAPRGHDAFIGYHAWIPIDDERCMVYSVDWHPKRPLTSEETDPAAMWDDIHAETLPGTDRAVLNRDNDYCIDRELQRSGRSFTGIRGLGIQDGAIQESQGPIYDRSAEHLGSSDRVIITIRQRLLATVEAHERGDRLPGLDPTSHRVRAVACTTPRSASLADVADVVRISPAPASAQPPS
jgi:nitrite reductase/ring-hydroxylating ferredoxin subunit